MNELIYPSLHLFTYDLRDGLGGGEEEIKNNHRQFWHNFPEDFPESLKVPLEAESQYAQTIDLLTLIDGQTPSYLFKNYLAGIKVEGFYYPVRIGDIYSLQFNCSVDDKVKPQPISCFHELKSLAPTQLGKLGKTWILSGYLSSAHSNYEAIAKAAYFDFRYNPKCQASKPSIIASEWERSKLGNLLGSTIYEVWIPPTKWESVEENIHILIILYPDLNNLEIKDKETAKLYETWMDLFCFRHKMTWAYCEAQKHKQWLKEHFFSLQTASPEIQDLFLNYDSKTLNVNTAKLQAALKSNFTIHSQYSLRLNRLELQSQTIDINLYNYKKSLSRLTKKASQLGDSNLDFLKDFIDIVDKKYLIQLNKDHASLRPGLTVRETLTETLTGFVQIEQTEQDRRIEDTIAIVGVGVGTASVVASAVSPLVESITQRPSKDANNRPLPANGWLNFGVAFIISIAMGALLGWPTLLWLRSRRHSSTK
jgi:hypothetical protein